MGNHLMCSVIPFNSRLCLSVLCVWITACNIANPNSESPQTTPSPTPFVIVESSYVLYGTMQELVDRADIIIIGRPVGENGVINTNRNPSDTSQPDPSEFSLGQIYEIEVLHYIEGEGPATLYAIQYQGCIFEQVGEEISESDIERARQREGIIPLSLNQRYIMFLYLNDVYQESPLVLYSGTAHPWKFSINELDCVQPEDELDLQMYFPPQTLESFITWIENPGMYQLWDPYAYPYPYPYPHTQYLIFPTPDYLNPCAENQPYNPYP